jgi:hypothetical protein
MKKKIGNRSRSGRAQRNEDLDRKKHRKNAKKKLVAHPPPPLWLQVSSRVD